MLERLCRLADKTSFMVSIFSISAYILKKRLSFTPGTPKMFDLTTRAYAHRSRWIWYWAHIYLFRHSLRGGSQYASGIGVFIFAKRDAVIMQKGRHTKRPCCYRRLKIVSVSPSPPRSILFSPLEKHTLPLRQTENAPSRVGGANSQAPGCQERPHIKSMYLRRAVGSGTVGAERAHLFDGATEYLLQLNSCLSWKLMMPLISGLIRLSWKGGGGGKTSSPQAGGVISDADRLDIFALMYMKTDWLPGVERNTSGSRSITGKHCQVANNEHKGVIMLPKSASCKMKTT